MILFYYSVEALAVVTVRFDSLLAHKTGITPGTVSEGVSACWCCGLRAASTSPSCGKGRQEEDAQPRIHISAVEPKMFSCLSPELCRDQLLYISAAFPATFIPYQILPSPPPSPAPRPGSPLVLSPHPVQYASGATLTPYATLRYSSLFSPGLFPPTRASAPADDGWWSRNAEHTWRGPQVPERRQDL